MENFNYTNYLKNNSLLKETTHLKDSSPLKETTHLKDSSPKIKVSELKSKIRERILNELKEASEEEEKTKKDTTEEEDIIIDDTEIETEESKNTDPNVEAVQGLLTKAQQQAEKLGDEKLLAQIGNTITYFTRAHVVKDFETSSNISTESLNISKKKIAEIENVEDERIDSEEIMGKVPDSIWAKFKSDVKKPTDIARHMITFYKELVKGESFDPSANPVFNMAINKLQDVAKEPKTDLSKKSIKSEED